MADNSDITEFLNTIGAEDPGLPSANPSGQINNPESNNTLITTSPENESAVTEKKTMRPLNAFMAYRSYYKGIFKGYKQKIISGYLTDMWKADPYHCKWALVAKVYSFIRDEVGKDSAQLSTFLTVVCPIMGFPSPGLYFQKLGLFHHMGEEGDIVLGQDKATLDAYMKSLEDMSCPLNDIDLLRACINKGYLSTHTGTLMEKLEAKSNSLMVTTAQPLVETQAPPPMAQASSPDTEQTMYLKKVEFVNSLRADPVKTAAGLFGISEEDRLFQIGVDVVMYSADPDNYLSLHYAEHESTFDNGQSHHSHHCQDDASDSRQDSDTSSSSASPESNPGMMSDPFMFEGIVDSPPEDPQPTPTQVALRQIDLQVPEFGLYNISGLDGLTENFFDSAFNNSSWFFH
uniref:Putative mating type 1-1-1 protein n=1 Tax=Knoxdaviesia capensis TaxID=114771 RepID=A0A1J0CYC9_9PEZI|nr:putative mating type 1-1-1 protein [Knoxdaviesia capensis]